MISGNVASRLRREIRETISITRFYFNLRLALRESKQNLPRNVKIPKREKKEISLINFSSRYPTAKLVRKNNLQKKEKERNERKERYNDNTGERERERAEEKRNCGAWPKIDELKRSAFGPTRGRSEESRRDGPPVLPIRLWPGCAPVGTGVPSTCLRSLSVSLHRLFLLFQPFLLPPSFLAFITESERERGRERGRK